MTLHLPLSESLAHKRQPGSESGTVQTCTSLGGGPFGGCIRVSAGFRVQSPVVLGTRRWQFKLADSLMKSLGVNARHIINERASYVLPLQPMSGSIQQPNQQSGECCLAMTDCIAGQRRPLFYKASVALCGGGGQTPLNPPKGRQIRPRSPLIWALCGISTSPYKRSSEACSQASGHDPGMAFCDEGRLAFCSEGPLLSDGVLLVLLLLLLLLLDVGLWLLGGTSCNNCPALSSLSAGGSRRSGS